MCPKEINLIILVEEQIDRRNLVIVAVVFLF